MPTFPTRTLLVRNRRLTRAFFRSESAAAAAIAALAGDPIPALGVVEHVRAKAAELPPGVPAWVRSIVRAELELWADRFARRSGRSG